VITSSGTTGYAVARPCRDGFKIGPLFADDMSIALRLLEGLADACEGGDLNIDIPADQSQFMAELAAAGLSPTFTTTRMYKGSAPKLDPRRIFGVTTLELG
jgi:hypothetical protein